jgi:hypothetical protein
MEGIPLLSLLRSKAHANIRQANAIGRSSKTVREFLEKNHKDDMTREESIKLAIKSLLEVVQTGAKNIEITVMERYGVVTVGCALAGVLSRTDVGTESDARRNRDHRVRHRAGEGGG